MPFLMHGDCLEKMRDIPDGSVDMVFADLPYGVTQNRWDVVIPFEPLWEQLLRVGKKNCAFVFTATQPFATALINSQPKLFRYDLIWRKGQSTGIFHAKKAPLRTHETVLVFYRIQPTYNPQMWDAGKPANSTGIRKTARSSENYGSTEIVNGRVSNDRYPLSVLDIRDRENGQHSTQKPVVLLEWLIKTYSNPGDVILDPTMGSGTTGVACMNTGRHFIGIEKDATYFEVARKRIEATLTSAVE